MSENDSMAIELIGNMVAGLGEIANIPALAVQIHHVGAAALPEWSITKPEGGSIYETVVLRFIQLIGMVGVLKGSLGLMRYYSPERHPKAPPTVAMPLTQFLLGLMALVPEVVVGMAYDLFERINW